MVVGFNQKGSFDEIITQFLWFCSISDSSKRTPHPSSSATFSHESWKIVYSYNFIFQNIPFLTAKRPVLCNSNILKTRHMVCTDCRFIFGQNILEFAILAFPKPFNRCFMTRLQSYQSIYVNKLSIICPSHSNQWKNSKKLEKNSWNTSV